MFDVTPLRETNQPHALYEQGLMDMGYRAIVGIDEVGRGPLAGPVVVAGVILDMDNIPEDLNDSKKLSAKKRQSLYGQILAQAKAVSIASICAKSIDDINIRQATLKAMCRVVSTMAIKADYALIDGNDLPQNLCCPGQTIIQGDRISLSIAAASIVAKVTRDNMMAIIDNHYPQYEMAKHVGYATKAHRDAIDSHGPIEDVHRFSFAPVKNMNGVLL